MASKEKIKKKRTKAPSPAVQRKSSVASSKTTVSKNTEIDEDEKEILDSMQGSQVSVRSATEENIKDNTMQDQSQHGEGESLTIKPTPSELSPRPSSSDAKKAKTDHVDEKLEKKKRSTFKPAGVTPKQGLTVAPAPVRGRNNVSPVPDEKTVMGSAVSLRSNVSRASKEAWVEAQDSEAITDHKSPSSSKTKSSSRRPNSVVSLQSTRDATQDGLKGIKVEAEEDSPEKHAYIPYLYARNCIAKIMEDMKKMKTNHILIVENIQTHYTSIESETQEQFNMFVICMKEDYASKRHTFREMIDKHKEETEKKESYWNEMLASLAERNSRLLREKRTILMKNQTEIERLEKEKAESSREWAEKLNSAPVPVPVDMSQWEEEKKILEDQLQNEKINVASLEKQLAMNGKISTPTIADKDVATVEHTANAASGGMAVGLLAVTRDNNNQMEKERKEMEEERQRLTEERGQLEDERQGFGTEREKWLGEIGDLQTQLGDKNKEGSEWKTKHDVLHGRLNEVSDVQAKYLALENQYAALAQLVKNTDTTASVKEEMEKTAEEKQMMTEEKTKLEADIKKFETAFVKKNGRKPTEDDKSDSVKELYTTHGEVETMVASLEQKENTFKQVESGTVPEAPEISHKPVDTRSPEVVTVEVKVPDPTIITELERVHETVTITRTQVTTLKQEVSDLRSEMGAKNDEIAKLKLTIAELESQIADLKAGDVTMTAVGTGGGASEEELDALKQENRELRRDMKKMIKQYERLASRQQGESAGGDESEQVAEMAEAMTVMDNKIADLESENEAFKEERLILREKIKTITETITITNGEGNKKLLEDKDRKIEELMKELESLRDQNTEMQKDILKMVKSHGKTKARLSELQEAEKAVKMLEVVVMLIHNIHGEVPDAAQQVNVLLDDADNHTSQSKQVLDVKQAAYQKWVEKYEAEHGKPPGKKDGDKEAEQLVGEWEVAKRDFKTKHLKMSALKLIQTGDMKHAEVKTDNTSAKAEIELKSLETALSAADNRVIDLEADNQKVMADRDRYKNEVQELEAAMEELRKQNEMQTAVMADSESSAELTKELSDLRKKCDGFESELMQERMSHVNTRDELETLRKQLDVVKEEMENEKQGVEARVEGVKTLMETQLQAKDEELKSLQDRTDLLEAERLSNLPPDTAKEIKELQDKLKQVEKDKGSSKTSSAVLNAQVAELTSKLDVAAKNLETQRASNRELEAKVKANRMEKEKETKRVSKHMEDRNQKAASEDKQRITMLVKRVKELEARAGKGTAVPVPVGGVTEKGEGGATVHMLKREVKDQEAKIKQLEKELRQGGGIGGVAGKESGSDKMKSQKHEKILKELDKRLDHEKEKSGQLLAGLKAADDENKALQKELEDKTKNLVKVSAELKTISMAAKEGVEAAMKVKELESSNKHLKEENNVLTKNFESERVLRKKYYNMVEDMKGKIRVYCRARPMSKSETGRGNQSVLKSLDEYSISVETSRGLKEFQYDAVFMEDSSQEKIFEDTNNLIQSAFDGYNVCIFAYGQTGSGKTFTMIGDREQNFPGIAPRAFQRVFQMGDEVKDKFTLKIEVYMMELYNEKLIDLFAKPSSDDHLQSNDEEKLEIKKDKKGMVFVQGAVIKTARNSKELFALFEEGSLNRHTASTKMNAESSRSHLVVGIILETTNKNTGNITRGKLSLVDLAGSERVAKTQAGAEQLKEAMSINKSLSALGDVISALSSEQQFIPYRNNKLTMLMQDSLGGNAKTLMFVNISPADYNMDETVISLTYASRVKLITNDASKNADNKEIARLKAVIARLMKGERVAEEDV